MVSCCLVFAVSAGLADTARAENDFTVYDDALRGSWENWSWASVDLASTAVVRSGTTSIAVNASPFSALWFRHVSFDSSGFGSVSFWINGGPTGGQRLHVASTLNDSGQPGGVDIPPLVANTWQQVTIPLASLGAANVPSFSGFWLQEWAGLTQPTYYVDDVSVTRSAPVVPAPPLNHGMAMYDDAFAEGWQNWSWASVSAANVSPVSTGASSIAVRAGPFTALAFHHAAVDTSMYASLTFWVNPGRGTQQLILRAVLSGTTIQPGFTFQLTADPDHPWQKVSVPLGAFGADKKSDLTDIWLQEIGGVDQSANPYYIDDMRLDLAASPSPVSIRIDGKLGGKVVDARVFGLNANVWDGSFNTSTTADLLLEASNQALRFGGGSLSDEYHWQTNTSEGQTFHWATSLDSFANVALATGARVFVTANYGSGTPEEAALEVQYANQKQGYGFQYWEIGNESYGTWETDHNARPHDPVLYATRFRDYAAQMKAADPTVKIGAVVVVDEDSFANYADESAVNPRTGATHQGWNAVMLSTLRQLGVTPDFVIYHRYEQGPTGESDSFLLGSARTWASDVASMRGVLNDYLGASAAQVEIICTENNSVFSNPGTQTTSLVNGLFMADSIANVMKTELKGFFWWNLRNGQELSNNNNPSLYGWRRFGDYGIVTAATPAGPADRYPTYYAYKLLSHYARGGESVVTATSDYSGVAAYAVRDPRSHTLNLLVINKHPTATLNLQISVRGVDLGRQAEIFSYGIADDEAIRVGLGSTEIRRTTTALSGPSFVWRPGPYSATVIRLPTVE
ncbi:MAG TPA: hypothetical protein VFK02_08165 [Kofleriaceae bacterium]|nr:hypothetical protein [Kofleriaceae bacterium]